MLKLFRKRNTRILLYGVGAFVYAIFHLMFLWVYEHGDSWYYMAFAEFLKTGKYPFQFPFIYQKPTTIAAPFYSLLILLYGLFPRGDIALHIVQLAILFGTSYFIYRILTHFTNKETAAFAAFIHLFVPANIIFVSYAMTEIPTQFLLTVGIFILIRYFDTKNTTYLSFLTFVTVILMLLRYQFSIVFGVTVIINLYMMIKKRSTNIIPWMLTILSVTILFGWIWYNHSITGVWGISDTVKIRFHAAFVAEGKFFPSEENPAVLELRKYVPATVDKYTPWWGLQQYILPKIDNDWHRLDEIIGNVGVAAIREHPIAYLFNTVNIFIRMHTTTTNRPWWFSLGWYSSPDPIAQQWVNCRTQHAFTYCRPIIMTPWSFALWDRFIKISTDSYESMFRYFSIFIFFPSMVLLLFSGQLIKRILVLIYLIPQLYASMGITPEPRYLVVYYPLILVICVLGIGQAGKALRKNRHAE